MAEIDRGLIEGVLDAYWDRRRAELLAWATSIASDPHVWKLYHRHWNDRDGFVRAVRRLTYCDQDAATIAWDLFSKSTG
jgi:hypothetical protein